MAQFDVYQNLNPETSRQIPYLLDIQTDLLSSLVTRMVVPLALSSTAGKAIKNLNLTFKIKNTSVVMLTSEMAGIPISLLGSKVTSLSNHRIEIIHVLDFLFTGI